MTTVERANPADQEFILDLLQKQFAEHEIVYSSDTLSTAIEEILKRDDRGIFFVALTCLKKKTAQRWILKWKKINAEQSVCINARVLGSSREVAGLDI